MKVLFTITYKNHVLNVTEKVVTSNHKKYTYLRVGLPSSNGPIEIRGRTKEELMQNLKLACGERTLTSPTTKIEDFLLNWVEKYNSPPLISTYYAYKHRINDKIIPEIGNLTFEEINEKIIEDFFRKLLSTISINGTHDIYAVLKLGLDYAVRKGYIHGNYCLDIKLQAWTHLIIHPLTHSECSEFLKIIKHDPFRNLYRLCLYCGLRINEAIGLSWDDVDWINSRLHIHQQIAEVKIKGKLEHIHLDHVKNKNEAFYLPVSDEVLSFLKEQKEIQERQIASCRGQWNNHYNNVLTNEKGHHLIHRTVRTHFKNAAVLIGRPDARIHDLRHTAASIALETSGNIFTVKELLNHNSLSSTMIYTHVYEDT